MITTGADPVFQVRGGRTHLKKVRRAEGGANIFGVFRVKNPPLHYIRLYLFDSNRLPKGGNQKQ
jgi:hypothetical protein